MVLERLQRTSAVVPEIWPLDSANALVIGERRQRLTRSDAETFLELVLKLPITVSKVVEDIDSRPIVFLARRYALSTYDAAYLYLSLRDRLPLATNDARLLAAAEQAGVEPL